MWVGGLQHPDPGKHVAELAATPRELPLVLVGPTRPWAHELPDVTLTGHVSDEHLAAIYSGAHALVVPSEDEGFGLPAVEALACGTPVVACEVPALREVLDDRATFVQAGRSAGAGQGGRGGSAPGPASAILDLAATLPAPPGAYTSTPRPRKTGHASLVRSLRRPSAETERALTGSQ